MTDFIEITDLKKYVKDKESLLARKIAQVEAIQVSENTIVETIMQDGHKETINVATPGDYVVTNPSGEKYVIKERDFLERYSLIKDNVYRAKGDVVSVCKVPDNISFIAPWGEKMNIKKGGYLVISNPEDIYGIQEAEFNETYQVLPTTKD